MTKEEIIKTKFSDEFFEKNRSSKEDLSMVALEYTGCTDCILSDEACKSIFSAIFETLNISELSSYPFSLALNNTGNGQLILSAPNNASIFVFNSDEIAANIAQVQSSVRESNLNTELYQCDISILFGGDFNSNFNLDAVIVQGTCDREFYTNIDSELFYRSLSPYQYFTLRAKNLIRPGGVVVSIIPTDLVYKVITFAEEHGLKSFKSISYQNVKAVFFKVQ
jgi:hypothetical protein